MMSDQHTLLMSLALAEVDAENNGSSYFDHRSQYNVFLKTYGSVWMVTSPAGWEKDD